MFSAIPIVLFATAPGAHPIVSVDTSAINDGGLPQADALRLRGSLLVRLIEEGYRVAAGTGNVQIWLTVRPNDSGWSIEARGLGVRDYHVDPAPLAVQSLEILQRAMLRFQASETRGRTADRSRLEGGAPCPVKTSSDCSASRTYDFDRRP
jgi:hypothetical protein